MPKRVVIVKTPKASKAKTVAKKTTTKSESAKAKSGTSTIAKPNEKVIKKTDQLEIRREN